MRHTELNAFKPFKPFNRFAPFKPLNSEVLSPRPLAGEGKGEGNFLNGLNDLNGLNS